MLSVCMQGNKVIRTLCNGFIQHVHHTLNISDTFLLLGLLVAFELLL